MITADNITLRSARWTFKQAERVRRRTVGRKLNVREQRVVSEMLGRLAVARRDLERLGQ